MTANTHVSLVFARAVRSAAFRFTWEEQRDRRALPSPFYK